MSWSPDGRYIASGDMDGRIWLWDGETGQALGQCSGHKKWITSLVRASGWSERLGLECIVAHRAVTLVCALPCHSLLMLWLMCSSRVLLLAPLHRRGSPRTRPSPAWPAS